MSEKLTQALQPIAELRRHPDPAELLYPEDEGVVENALQIVRGQLFDMKVSDAVTLVRTRELRMLRQEFERIKQLEDQLHEIRQQRDELLHLAEQAHREIDELRLPRSTAGRDLNLRERCRLVRATVDNVKRQATDAFARMDEAHETLNLAGVPRVVLGENIGDDHYLSLQERCEIVQELLQELERLQAATAPA